MKVRGKGLHVVLEFGLANGASVSDPRGHVGYHRRVLACHIRPHRSGSVSPVATEI